MVTTVAAILATVSVAILPAPVAGAATLTVSNCANTGAGSLRQAVASAASGDTITFSVSCPPGSPIILTSGPIDVTVDLTISGPGAGSMAVSGDNASEVFEINTGITVTLSGITVEHGTTGAGCAAGCAASGGGIENNGTLTVTGSVVDDNSANSGCFSNCGASGGGIENNGTLTVTDSTVSDNSANGSCFEACSASGGGIVNNGTMTVTGSTVSDNEANGGCVFNCGASGGGIENNSSDTATISTSTVASNEATLGCTAACGSSGGGIDNGGTLTLGNSTVATNFTGAFCGSNCAAFGGGIANESGGTLTLTNSTLSANAVATGCGPPTSCGAFGGDLYNDGTASVGATILANSAGAGGGDCFFASPVTDLGYNLDDDGTCGLSSANHSFSDTPAGLDPAGLQNNGGPTQTIELQAGSAAVDHVAAILCPATDQRGSPRIAPCDIGAYDTDGPILDGSQVHDVIQVETSPSYANDPIHIDSSQLQNACGGTITFETIQGTTTRAPRTSTDSITVILDDDGNVSVVVDGSDCSAGTDLIEADLTVAPYLTATTILTVEPPQVSPEGVSASPANEVETGNTPGSGDSNVYTVFYVETSPAYAEQPVEISSPQLEDRCGDGWRWEPGVGAPINQASGTVDATGTLDNDGNAVFVFKGASCATGTSTVIADVEAGSHPTYTTTFTVSPPTVTLGTPPPPPTATTKAGSRAHPGRRRHHGGSGSGSGSGTPSITVTASPNPVLLTGEGQGTPSTLTLTKTDSRGGSSITGAVGTAYPGDPLVYTITVTNNGSSPADGVQVKDPLSGNADFESDSYTSAETNGATGATPSGTGDINDVLNLPGHSSVVYTVTAELSCELNGEAPNLTNTATATFSATTLSATDSDTIGPNDC
ncbi:MAG TPA: DUF11 domain-containing protein [Acidimicrobiales bacterium]|nr:DUF11 domain-containing protein [Acidimicrobiales bacterium]